MNTPRQDGIAEQGVLAILVLYGRDPVDSSPWPLLASWLERTDGLRLQHCLIYDNSPVPGKVSALPPNAKFVSDPGNGGTAAAYRAAALHAAEHRCEWLLLLDQDSVLPPDYLEQVQNAAEATPHAVALVPQVLHGDDPVSPAVITASGSIVPCARPGTTGGITTAISSGVIVRRASMMAMAFPPEIWLDYVDHWMFLDFYRRGERVAFIDAQLSHDLSVRTPKTLSPFRLHSILAAESAFYRALGGRGRAMLPLRRLLRSLRYLLVGRPALARIVVKTLFERRAVTTR